MKKQIVSTTLLAVLVIVMVFVGVGGCWADAASDLTMAREMYQTGDFDGAVKLLKAASLADPTVSAEALKMMGYCYRAKANTSEALRAFEKLVADYPKSSALTSDVKDNITCLAYRTKGESKEAVSSLRSMASKYPDDALMWRYLASERLRNDGLEAEALAELLRAWDQPAAKVHRIWEAKANVTMYAMSFADFDKMITDAQAALSADPSDSLLWKYIVGYAYLCKEKYSEAITELDAASQLTQSDKKIAKQGKTWRSVKYALGCAYEKSKKFDKALPLYKEVAEKYPGYWRAQYGVFVCLAKQEDLAKASAYINKVCADQPAIKDRLRRLTMNYMLSEVEP